MAKACEWSAPLVPDIVPGLKESGLGMELVASRGRTVPVQSYFLKPESGARPQTSWLPRQGFWTVGMDSQWDTLAGDWGAGGEGMLHS